MKHAAAVSVSTSRQHPQAKSQILVKATIATMSIAPNLAGSSAQISLGEELKWPLEMQLLG